MENKEEVKIKATASNLAVIEEIVKDYYYKHSEDSNIRNRCDMALSLLNSVKEQL